MRRILILAVAMLMCMVAASAQTSVAFRVCRVVDGDTFEGGLVGNDADALRGLNSFTVRVSGIDAPERNQPYGDMATVYLKRMIGGLVVRLEVHKKDQYGRWVATVRYGSTDIAEEMLSEGMAWHYSEFDNNLRYEALEEGARYRKVGLWKDDQPVAPWEWRRMSKAERDRIRVKN